MIDVDTARLATRFRRRELDDAAERKVADAVRESQTAEAPRHQNMSDPADAELMRGVPVLAPGVGGTMRVQRNPDGSLDERQLKLDRSSPWRRC